VVGASIGGGLVGSFTKCNRRSAKSKKKDVPPFNLPLKDDSNKENKENDANAHNVDPQKLAAPAKPEDLVAPALEVQPITSAPSAVALPEDDLQPLEVAESQDSELRKVIQLMQRRTKMKFSSWWFLFMLSVFASHTLQKVTYSIHRRTLLIACLMCPLPSLC
jgi:hypothetical protein